MKTIERIGLLTIISPFILVGAVLLAKPPQPTRPQPGAVAGSTEFHFSPARESVKFRHPAFTTITCSTRTGLLMSEPPTSGTVTGFSTAPFARIVMCVSDKPMVEIP